MDRLIAAVDVKAQPIGDLEARLVWTEFSSQIGGDALLKCYGWHRAPWTLRPGELAWAYRTEDDLVVGWGSLIKDPTAAVYWHASGVFPAFARRGYRRAIRRHLCAEAFARGAQAVSLAVLDTNPEHLMRCQREADEGGPWRLSGHLALPPPGQTVFTLMLEDARRVVPSRDRACCCAHLWLPGLCPITHVSR